MDKITLKSIEYFAHHGYYDEERQRGNRFEVDITAKGNFSDAANGDELEKTFDYERAEKMVSDVMNGKSVKLIETICKRIGDDIFSADPSILELKVAIRKLSPPIKNPAQYSEIVMKWKR